MVQRALVQSTTNPLRICPRQRKYEACYYLSNGNHIRKAPWVIGVKVSIEQANLIQVDQEVIDLTTSPFLTPDFGPGVFDHDGSDSHIHACGPE